MLLTASGKGVTVSVAVRCTPSTVAVIVALPGDTAVTVPEVVPDEPMVAMDEFDVLQATVRSVRTVPEASRTVAVMALVWPTRRSIDAGASVTVATGGRTTANEKEVVRPSHDAVMVT